jgi:hypothetical protein
VSGSTKFVLKNLAAGAIAWVGGEIAKRAYALWEASFHEDEEGPVERVEARLARIEGLLAELGQG